MTHDIFWFVSVGLVLWWSIKSNNTVWEYVRKKNEIIQEKESRYNSLKNIYVDSVSDNVKLRDEITRLKRKRSKK